MIGLQVHALQLCWSLVFWIALHEAAYLLLGLARRRIMICWSIGPLGIATTYVREPGRGFLLAQLLLPAALAALFLRFLLFQQMPPPILHLPQGALAQLLTIVTSVVLTSGIRAVMLVRDWRYPIWGEARLLRTGAWSRATCAALYFTAFGRAFLRERFQATPREFVQTV
ncbi:MAG TPA: hypothetical protein VH599_08850 [Ktedonobacterales bacterium]